MENKSIFSPAFAYGFIVSIVLILFKLILFLAGVDENSYLQILFYVVFALGLLYTMTIIRNKNLGGYITFGKAFMVGFYATLAISIVMAIYTYFYMTQINPEMIEEAMSQAEEKIIEANPEMSDEDLETALNAAKIFMQPGIMSIMSIFGTLITGTLLSLVGAAFVKRKNPETGI